MQWIWIILGLMLLMTAALLTMLLRRRRAEAFCRIPGIRKVLRLLRRTANLPGDTQEIAALQDSALSLMEHIHRLHRRLQETPPLPAAPDGEPRLMELARDAADGEHITPEALFQALSTWDHAPTSLEASVFPLCVGAAQCQRLALVLRNMQSDAQIRRRAWKLAHRLLRSKKPYALLDKAGLNSLGLSALARNLRQLEQPEATVLLERWLSVHEITTEDLARQDDQRQLQLAEEIIRAESRLRALDSLPWDSSCEEADHLHLLLMQDPGGVYPALTLESRAELRRRVELLGRRAHLQAEEIIRHALLLCEDAEPKTLERSLCWYMQDAEGLQALFRRLPTRKGRLYARFIARPAALRYLLLWGFGLFAGFCFLHSGEPVFMLPFFALTAGDLIRLAVSRVKSPPLPRMSLDHRHLRTLVVLPSVLHDPHEAIRMVRRLKTASHACPMENTEFLLLGDFPPAMTVVSSADGPIMEAAASAVAAIGDQLPLHYIQRGRAWDGDRHACCARGGRLGAVTELCRLIAQGECADVIACATLEPAALERRFDYVFVFSPHQPNAPGTLETLLQTMTHPLCSRYPTMDGWRGHAVLTPGDAPLFDGCGLLQPDACLEATDGLHFPALASDALWGELAGHTNVPHAHTVENTPAPSWASLLTAARHAWQLLPWQLPWVKTPTGVHNNPLGKHSRFLLREELRRTLVPLGQFILLLWAVLTQNWLLLVFVLLVPEVRHLSSGRSFLLKALCRLVLLPVRALLPLLPLWDVLGRKQAVSEVTPSVEIWVQGMSATLFAALGLLLPGFSVPALMLSAGFACFPLAHRYLEAPVHPDEPLTPDHLLLLEDTTEATWRFISGMMESAACPLPPASHQYEPGPLTAAFTTPEAISGAMLSCLCAKELGFVTAQSAADRIENILLALADLPLPFGLPCSRYALPALTVQDARVSAASTGFLTATLMSTAQALRTWLPELPPALADLSALAEAQLSRLDLTALYDESTGFFHAGLDADGQPFGTLHCLADEGLLLVIAACARKVVPPACLARLSRTCVRLGREQVPLSSHGAAGEHLLAGLFVPLDDQDTRAFVQAMQRRAIQGLWGQGSCCAWRFDASLNYQQSTFGLPDAALAPSESAPVFAPYAAALALTSQTWAAAEALNRFASLGAKGPHGFCDAVDLSGGVALVGLHDVWHQALILASMAHCLADAPLQRYLCALPEVEACLPLLSAHVPAITLPRLPRAASNPSAPDDVPLPVLPCQLPAPLQLIGTADFRLQAGTDGTLRLIDHDTPLNTHLHFYLRDEGRTYRLCDSHIPGEAFFERGVFRFEQVCGSLRCGVQHFTDALRRRALHVLTLTNLSTRDRVIDLADCLLPDLGAAQCTCETDHPQPGVLTLHARGTAHILRHTMDASLPPLASAVCTDAELFAGRHGSFQEPHFIEQSLQDLTAPAAAPCLSFRGRFALGGRGQLTVWFTTSLSEQNAPLLTELPGLARLAALQDAAIDASAVLSSDLRPAALMLPGLLQASGWQMALRLTDASFPILVNLLPILSWLRLHGHEAMLYILCPDSIRQTLAAALPDGEFAFASPDAAIPLVLEGDLPLSDQLERLYNPCSTEAEPHHPPVPAELPPMELLHQGEYGGFDPDSLDYIIRLAPGELPPVPWTNIFFTRHFRQCTDETGLRSPFEETVQIRMDDGTALSPWSTALPRTIRVRPGETDWEAWSSQLDVRLRACCLSGHRCGLRVLHIHNAADAPVRLRISVSTHLGEPLLCTNAAVMTDQPGERLQAFLAGSGWQVQTNGSIAVLSCGMELPPQRSGKALWLAGFARHGEDVIRALDTLKTGSASQLLRRAQATLAEPLSALTVSTPEPTFDLLMNRILPVQALCASGTGGVPALFHISPREAGRSLLRRARQPMSRDECAHFILLLAAYVHRTGDASLLHVNLPKGEMLPMLRALLLSVPLDHHSLPQGDDAALRCFLYARAAQALDALSPDPEALEFSRRLLNGADTYLWQDGFYGTPLRLDVQTHACAAYGANPRTHQAMNTCWKALYDEQHGLIRMRESDDSPPLPGLPENGGMVTMEAVRCLQALLKTGYHSEAFELLRALNPLHHTDTPERQSVFRCPPYQLHGGMYAAPMEAGRAVPDGEEAAAMLFAVLLEDVLGLRREGNNLRLHPCVPPEWEDFTLHLRTGGSAWHISAERRIQMSTLDGEPLREPCIPLHDDGKVHQVRFPLA